MLYGLACYLCSVMDRDPEEEESENSASDDQELRAAISDGTHRATRRKSRFGSMHVGSVPSGDTPQRSVFRQYSSGSRNIQQSTCALRQQECPGPIVCRVNKDIQDSDHVQERANGGSGSCTICGNRTRYFCIYCRHWYCISFGKGREKLLKEGNDIFPTAKKEYIVVPCTGNEGDNKKKHCGEMVFKNTCYVIGHRKHFQQMWEDENDSIRPTRLFQEH
jgi:hypothetical protein